MGLILQINITVNDISFKVSLDIENLKKVVTSLSRISTQVEQKITLK